MKREKLTRLNASQLLYLLKDSFGTYDKKDCESIVIKCSDTNEEKDVTASIESLEKHTGAQLQFAVDELWLNFSKRKNAMQHIKEMPLSKIYIKDASKIPKTISFPKTLRSFIPEDLALEIIEHWRNEYKNFDIDFK